MKVYVLTKETFATNDPAEFIESLKEIDIDEAIEEWNKKKDLVRYNKSINNEIEYIYPKFSDYIKEK